MFKTKVKLRNLNSKKKNQIFATIQIYKLPQFSYSEVYNINETYHNACRYAIFNDKFGSFVFIS